MGGSRVPAHRIPRRKRQRPMGDLLSTPTHADCFNQAGTGGPRKGGRKWPAGRTSAVLTGAKPSSRINASASASVISSAPPSASIPNAVNAQGLWAAVLVKGSPLIGLFSGIAMWRVVSSPLASAQISTVRNFVPVDTIMPPGTSAFMQSAIITTAIATAR